VAFTLLIPVLGLWPTQLQLMHGQI